MSTLTGTYTLPDGTPESGAITFRLSARVIDSDTPQVRTEGPITAYLDDTGSFTVELVPTDAPELAADGLCYEVTEHVGSRPTRVYYAELPVAEAPWRIETVAVYDSPLPTVLRYEMGPVGPPGPVGPVGERGPEGSRGPAGPSGGVNAYAWDFAGTSVGDPGTGRLAINGTGNAPRILSISKTDADGGTRDLLLLLPGDTITVTDYPDTGPVTGWARYALTGDPVDQGTWVQLDAIRTDASGTPTPPPVDTRLRVIASLASGGDLYPLRSDIWAAGTESVAPVVTAFDPATGRLAIAGIEMGDTGFRRIGPGDPLISPNITGGSVEIRRCGSVVEVVGINLATGPAWVPGEQFLNVSGGYNCYTTYLQPNTYNVGDARMSSSGGWLRMFDIGPNATNYRFRLVYTTPQAWPNVLEGTQVTPPAGQATILPMPEEPPE